MQDCVKELLFALNNYNPDNEDSVNKLRDLICGISSDEELKRDPFVAGLLYTASQKMRVFGYNVLNHYTDDPVVSDSELREIKNNATKALYRSKVYSNNILDRSQKEVVDLFQNIYPRRLLVSAPTSYGKTFLMREILFINHEQYRTVLLVFPTVALLQENARAMIKFVQDTGLEYQIVKTVEEQYDKTRDVIFVFTPERALQLLAIYPEIQIDFFFFDEVYKIDEDYSSDLLDEKADDDALINNKFLNVDRGKAFRISLYLLSKTVPEYYLAGPNLKRGKFGAGLRRYIEINNITVKEINFEPTLRIAVNAYNKRIVENPPSYLQQSVLSLPVSIDTHKYQKFSDVIEYISAKQYGKTLVYCTTPAKANKYSSVLASSKKSEDVVYPQDFQNFIDHIQNEYDIDDSSKNWSLIQVLKKGYGLHHGKLPKYIQQEILDQFNNGILHILFCTSTIVEGVNTDAQNVIIMNSSKGTNDLTMFDIKNIKGRAGRYYHCFVGRVFYMDRKLVTIENSDNFELDFVTFSEKELGAIDLDNTLIEDLTDSNQQKKSERDMHNAHFCLPDDVFIKNRTVLKEAQEALLQYLMYPNNFNIFEGLIIYPVDVDNFLTYGWLNKILKAFCAAGLIDEQTVKKFSAVSISYEKDGFKGILSFELKRSKNIDDAYSKSFRTLRDILEHKIPRILSLFESIIVFVATQKGYDMATFSLSKVSRYYETGVKSVLGESLIEFGFPLDAIRRIEKKFKNMLTMDIEQAKQLCRAHYNKEIVNLLDEYEQQLFIKAMKFI